MMMGMSRQRGEVEDTGRVTRHQCPWEGGMSGDQNLGGDWVLDCKGKEAKVWTQVSVCDGGK